MIVVNLFAGPGAGKSTTAAATFAMLKLAGVNCELVTEYAKDLTWDGALQPLAYQPLVFAQQAWRIERLRGKVDVVVTDSPLLLSLVYDDRTRPAAWADFVHWEAARDTQLNFRLKRTKPFNSIGRNQTEAQAVDLDLAILEMLLYGEPAFETVDGDGGAPAYIFAAVMRVLARQTGSVEFTTPPTPAPSIQRGAPATMLCSGNAADQPEIMVMNPLA